LIQDICGCVWDVIRFDSGRTRFELGHAQFDSGHLQFNSGHTRFVAHLLHQDAFMVR
jgi:hypothetical protein